MQVTQYRYPGAKPFDEEEHELFFGRERDIKDIYELLSVEQLFVLYGQSGLGKTSLLRAGLLPLLTEQERFLPFVLRFGAYQPEMEGHLSDLLSQKIYGNQPLPPLLSTLLPNDYSLWVQCKALQMQYPEPRTIILIFDQFEEIFTYPEPDVQLFKERLSELLHTKIPHRYRLALRNFLDEHPSEQQVALHRFHESLDVRVILAIRSDQLSLLNQFTDYFPEILRECYELTPLEPQQAEDAILNPAHQRKVHYASPQFDYSDEALDKILRFLTKDNQKKIASFQLQILCQYVEQQVIQTGKTYIEAQDLGDLENIYQNYYDHQMERIADAQERQAARLLIEEGLIFEEEERRLSLYKGQITRRYGIEERLLQQLVNTHLLRAETHPTSGLMYELSHDTLIKPILKSKQRRKAREEREKHEKIIQEQQAQKLDKRKRQYRSVLATLFVMGLLVTSILGYNYRLKYLEAEEARNEVTREFERNLTLERQLADAQKTEAWQLRDSLLAVKGQQVRLDDSIHTLQQKRDSLLLRYNDEVLNMTVKLIDISANKSALEQELQGVKEKNRELEQVKRKFLQHMDNFERLTSYVENGTSRPPFWFRNLKNDVLIPYRELKQQIEAEERR